MKLTKVHVKTTPCDFRFISAQICRFLRAYRSNLFQLAYLFFLENFQKLVAQKNYRGSFRRKGPGGSTDLPRIYDFSFFNCLPLTFTYLLSGKHLCRLYMPANCQPTGADRPDMLPELFNITV